MRRFASDRVEMIMERLRIPDDVPIEAKILEGEADDELLKYEHVLIHPTHAGVLLSALKRVMPSEVILIGGVANRPDLRKLRPDWTTLRLAARMLPKLRAGDDALLRGVILIIEEAGFRVRGVHELVPELLAADGHIAGPKARREDHDAIAAAARGALALGRLDAGQACVAIGKRIVALEGAEGTDLVLQRVADLRRSGRFAKSRGGVLVKLAKTGQDIRADLPTIGVSTVENAARAGLSGIAVHAHHALIADFEATCAKAAELGIFLIGIDPDKFDGAAVA